MFYAYTPYTPSVDLTLENVHVGSKHSVLSALAQTRALRTAKGWLLVSPTTGGWCVFDNQEYESYKRGFKNITDTEWKLLVFHLVQCRLLPVNGATQNPTAHPSKRFSLTLILSGRCNLACKYCYLGMKAKSPGPDLAPETALKAIRAAFQQPAGEILIDFGEIALNYSLFQELVLFAESLAQEHKDKKLTLAIQTNGTTLKPKVVDFLEAHQVIVGVSLDGPKRIHDQVRVFSSALGSHRSVQDGLREIIRRRMPHIVLCTVSAVNVDRTFEILDYFLGLEIWHFSFKPIIKKANAGVVWDSLGLSINQYCDFLDSIVDYAVVNHNWDALDDRMTKFAFRLLQDPRGWTDHCPTSECACGTHMLVVNPTGAIYPCPRFTSLSGDGLNLGYSLPLAVSSSAKLLPRPGAKRMPNRCKGCVWWPFCKGGCQLARLEEMEGHALLDPDCGMYRHLYKLIIERILSQLDQVSWNDSRKLGVIEVVDQSLLSQCR